MQLGQEFQSRSIISIPDYIVTGQKDDIRLKLFQNVENLLFSLPFQVPLV
jgi:hypothetical protein